MLEREPEAPSGPPPPPPKRASNDLPQGLPAPTASSLSLRHFSFFAGRRHGARTNGQDNTVSTTRKLSHVGDIKARDYVLGVMCGPWHVCRLALVLLRYRWTWAFRGSCFWSMATWPGFPCAFCFCDCACVVYGNNNSYLATQFSTRARARYISYANCFVILYTGGVLCE